MLLHCYFHAIRCWWWVSKKAFLLVKVSKKAFLAFSHIQAILPEGSFAPEVATFNLSLPKSILLSLLQLRQELRNVPARRCSWLHTALLLGELSLSPTSQWQDVVCCVNLNERGRSGPVGFQLSSQMLQSLWLHSLSGFLMLLSFACAVVMINAHRNVSYCSEINLLIQGNVHLLKHTLHDSDCWRYYRKRWKQTNRMTFRVDS